MPQHAEFNPFAKQAAAAEVERAQVARGLLGRVLASASGIGGGGRMGKAQARRLGLVSGVTLVFLLVLLRPAVNGSARGDGSVPATVVNAVSAQQQLLQQQEDATAAGGGQHSGAAKANGGTGVSSSSSSSSFQESFLHLPDDTARLVVQVNGCREVDGFHDDPGVRMLVILPSVSASHGCPRDAIVLYTALKDFPTGAPEPNLPRFELATILRTIPQRIDITDVFFNPDTRPPRGAAAFPSTAFARVLHIVTSARLDDAPAWGTRLADAGYTAVSDTAAGKIWRTDAH